MDQPHNIVALQPVSNTVPVVDSTHTEAAGTLRPVVVGPNIVAAAVVITAIVQHLGVLLVFVEIEIIAESRDKKPINFCYHNLQYNINAAIWPRLILFALVK